MRIERIVAKEIGTAGNKEDMVSNGFRAQVLQEYLARRPARTYQRPHLEGSVAMKCGDRRHDETVLLLKECDFADGSARFTGSWSGGRPDLY